MSIKINDFRGGMNTAADPSITHPAYSKYLVNADIFSGTLRSIKKLIPDSAVVNGNFHFFKDLLYTDPSYKDFVEYNNKLYIATPDGLKQSTDGVIKDTYVPPLSKDQLSDIYYTKIRIPFELVITEYPESVENVKPLKQDQILRIISVITLGDKIVRIARNHRKIHTGKLARISFNALWYKELQNYHAVDYSKYHIQIFAAFVDINNVNSSPENEFKTVYSGKLTNISAANDRIYYTSTKFINTNPDEVNIRNSLSPTKTGGLVLGLDQEWFTPYDPTLKPFINRSHYMFTVYNEDLKLESRPSILSEVIEHKLDEIIVFHNINDLGTQVVTLNNFKVTEFRLFTLVKLDNTHIRVQEQYSDLFNTDGLYPVEDLLADSNYYWSSNVKKLHSEKHIHTDFVQYQRRDELVLGENDSLVKINNQNEDTTKAKVYFKVFGIRKEPAYSIVYTNEDNVNPLDYNNNNNNNNNTDYDKMLKDGQ